MKLRKECPHGKYDEHPWDDWGEVAVFTCPGGVFLPDDTLIKALYEAANHEWLTSMRADSWEALPPDVQSRWSRAIRNALSVREAE